MHCWNCGNIPKRNRKQFLEYLNHKDERIRAYACQIETAGAWAVAERRLDRDLEEQMSELIVKEYLVFADIDHSPALDSYNDEIPF